MEQSKTTSGILLLLVLALAAASAQAAPWIDPGEEQLRHHIQVLADAGAIKAPITTWPLSWAAIATDLARATDVGLTDAQGWSLAYVKFYLARAEETFSMRTRAGTQSDPVAIRDFGADQREETEILSELDWVGEHFAGRLSVTWAPDAIDGQEYRHDGSYVAGMLGNWALSVGALDRWWGPGWQSSMILSSNARPVNAVSLQRLHSAPFETPWLRWIGPWTLTLFAGQLESSRAIPEAKLLGARLAIKPFSSLELGFSRTAQWGGEGRPQNFSSFWNAMTGNDNADTESVSGDNDPSNQLGAVDVRWSFPLLGARSAIYLQYTGEDEANGFPSRGMDVAGIETAFATGNLFHRFAVEYIDSMAGAHSEKRPNVAYEHSMYRSGYRYRGRPLGASVDNDTRGVTLRADHYFADSNQISWRIMQLDLNRDGTDRVNGWGGSGFAAENRTILAEILYSHIINDVKISTYVYNVRREFQWNDETLQGTGLGLAIDYRSR